MSNSKVKDTEFLLLSGEGKAGLNHFKYWTSEFVKANVSFSLLVRNRELLGLVKKEYPSVNILFAQSALDVEATFKSLPKLNTIFFMSNPANNIHVLRFNEYRHIFLGSEYSDRDAQVSKVIRAFDGVWVSSQSSIDKLANYLDVSSLTINKIGKPQLKEFREASALNKKKSVLINFSKKNNTYSNSYLFKDIINAIPKAYHLNLVLDKELLDRNFTFKGLKDQLGMLNWLNDREYAIYEDASDKLVTENQYIICDSNNYRHNFLALNAVICLFNPNKQMPLEALFANKYISFKGIPQFSTSGELSEIFANSEHLTQQTEFAEYWVGNSFTEKNEFLTSLNALK